MIPKTLSASSIHVADLCLKRWEAEYDQRSRGSGNPAADLGTAVHGALEDFVKAVHMEHKLDDKLENLLAYYTVWTVELFGTSDHDLYQDGIDMLTEWYARTDFSEFEVISCENKLSFNLPTSVGPIQFNYIFDRMDKLSEGVYRVVDYKSIRFGYNPEDLHKKVQPRTYALAAAIQLKAQGIEVEKIVIQFDLLRHQPIGTWFTREQNTATWKSLIRIAERIIATPTGHAPPTLNAECVFCPIKAKCPELKKSLYLGGATGMTTEQLIDLRAMMDYQKKAVDSSKKEIDDLLMQRAIELDQLEFATEDNRMQVTVKSNRTVDASRVEHIVGTETFARFGGLSLTLAGYDKMMKDASISDDQKKQLKSLVAKKTSEPFIKVESRGFDAD